MDNFNVGDCVRLRGEGKKQIVFRGGSRSRNVKTVSCGIMGTVMEPAPTHPDAVKVFFWAVQDWALFSYAGEWVEKVENPDG